MSDYVDYYFSKITLEGYSRMMELKMESLVIFGLPMSLAQTHFPLIFYQKFVVFFVTILQLFKESWKIK